ncbi:MAG: transporter, permease component [Chitinophagaceae bacterium]|nr:transporter, permease component [Chitinophagaceae bacterium]
MNESPNKRAVIVGLFVLVGLLFLAAGILTIGNLHETFTTKMRVNTVFEDVSGLQAGNNVWFSGVKIGTVKKVRFHGKSQVRVLMNIDEDAQQYIRKDAKVKISTDGLIGNKILIIYGGTPTAGVIQEDDTLHVEKTLSTEDMMNTFQESNVNVQEITNDLKKITGKLSKGEGSIGKLLNDETIYKDITATTASLQKASQKAQALMTSLSTFSAKLNDKGTLANDLVTDTVVFKSVKASIAQLQHIADSASAMVDDLKKASTNPKSPVGVLLYDEETGTHLKESMKNLESSSAKLDEDLEALQHNFLLRHYFKKKAKEESKK